MKRRDFLKSITGIIGGVIGTKVLKPEVRVIEKVVERNRDDEIIQCDYPRKREYEASGSCMVIMGDDYKWFGARTPKPDEEILDLVRNGHRVKAMAAYRKKYNCQIAEARDAIDGMIKDAEWENNE